MRRAIASFGVALAFVLAIASPASAANFGLKELGIRFFEEDNSAATLAGSHPFGFTTRFELNTDPDPEFGEVPAEALKDLFLEMPPGIVGDPFAVPRCSNEDFADIRFEVGLPSCPNNTAVGAVALRIGFFGPEFRAAPVYNLEPTPGYVAKLGIVTLNVPVTIDIGVNPKPPFNLQVHVTNVSQAVRFYGSSLTVWGNPANPVHDPYRGSCLGVPLTGTGEFTSAGNCPSDLLPERAFLTLPRSCPTSPLVAEARADSWQHPGALTPPVATTTPTMTDCQALEFKPTIASKTTSVYAESPTGLDFNLDVNDPKLSEPQKRADSDIRKVVVTLPEGVTTNPAAAAGLTACSTEEYESETAASTPGTGCPNSAKVGSVDVETPLLEGKVLHGSIYVAKQGQNPFGNLLTLYLVIKDPEMGILIRQAGRVDPDPNTGRLRTTFDNVPQLPFSHFRFHFRSGQRAPLITPATCGSFKTEVELYPQSDPAAAPLGRSDLFDVSSGANNAPCASSTSQLPNAPDLSAGTLDPTAGAYAPFVLTLKREDGTQQLSSVSTKLPQGLLGRLTGIPYCSDAQIAQAISRSGEGQGALELAQPSCPASSQVGTVQGGTGAGTEPYFVPGKVYLAGPYRGAPLSLEIITPAIAGPFDLGVVAVRTALHLDLFSAEITAVSDPIPTILHGLPLDLRSIAINMNRSDFTLNPTSCEPAAITGSVTSTLGSVTPLSQYFQVSKCGSLRYKPKLKLTLKGKTKRSGHPSVKAVLTVPQKGSYANTARIQVGLPHSEFLDQGNLDKVCTQPQMRAATCPKRSVYGHVKVWTPLFEKPLQGNVYIGVGFGHQLPDLVTELNGQVRVLLHGRVDTNKREGIRNTFEFIPDAPYSRVVLQLKGGKKYGLIENSENICLKPQNAAVSFKAHNGDTISFRAPIRNDCRRRKNQKQHKRHKHHRP